MPRNRFSFAVFVGCKPNRISIFTSFFKFSDDFFVVWINFVSHGEIIVHIDFGIFANMADRSKNLKIITQVFFNSLGFGGRLDDEEIFRHIFIYYHACQLEEIFRKFAA